MRSTSVLYRSAEALKRSDHKIRFYSTQPKNQPFQHTDRNGQRKMACRHANARVTPILASVCAILPLCGARGITTDGLPLDWAVQWTLFVTLHFKSAKPPRGA